MGILKVAKSLGISGTGTVQRISKEWEIVFDPAALDDQVIGPRYFAYRFR